MTRRHLRPASSSCRMCRCSDAGRAHIRALQRGRRTGPAGGRGLGAGSADMPHLLTSGGSLCALFRKAAMPAIADDDMVPASRYAAHAVKRRLRPRPPAGNRPCLPASAMLLFSCRRHCAMLPPGASPRVLKTSTTGWPATCTLLNDTRKRCLWKQQQLNRLLHLPTLQGT